MYATSPSTAVDSYGWVRPTASTDLTVIVSSHLLMTPPIPAPSAEIISMVFLSIAIDVSGSAPTKVSAFTGSGSNGFPTMRPTLLCFPIWDWISGHLGRTSGGAYGSEQRTTFCFSIRPAAGGAAVGGPALPTRSCLPPATVFG